MKKAGYIVSALGVAVIIFSVVCFISAGSLLNEIEQYMGIMSGYMDASDMLDLALESGFDAGDFRVFAYQARVWLLVVGLALLAAGAALIFAGRKNTRGVYGQQYNPVYGGYDEYDDTTVAVAHHADAASVTCPACGTACSADAAFCRNCGAALSAPEPSGKMCHACGAENDDDARFCRECGHKLEEEDCDDATSGPAQIDWDAFRPESESVGSAEAGDAPDETETAGTGSVDAPDVAAPAVPEVETVRMDTTETTGVFRKSDSFDAASRDARPAEGNPFLRKAGDL